MGAVLVGQSDSSRKEGPVIPLLHTLISLLLTELPSDVIVTCWGRDSITSSDDSLSIILLSPTTCSGSRGHPRMELAFLISLSSLFLPDDFLMVKKKKINKKIKKFHLNPIRSGFCGQWECVRSTFTPSSAADAGFYHLSLTLI